MKNFLFLFLLFSQIFSIFAQMACTWDDGNGNKYDLTPLTNNNQDYFIPKNPNQWDIWLNVCRPTLTTVCGADVAGCQEWDSNSPNGQASLGLASSAVITPPSIPGKDGYGVTIQYTGGSQLRQMEIDFLCDPNAGTGIPAYNGENPQLHYNFKWASQYACPVGKQGGGNNVEEGVDAAALAIFIILIVSITLYFVIGILIKKFKMGATGCDILPNSGFWTSLPGLVKDGFMFIINKIRGRSGTYTQV